MYGISKEPLSGGFFVYNELIEGLRSLLRSLLSYQEVR
jgi:hypothetical protein